jgi:hypothetical protein
MECSGMFCYKDYVYFLLPWWLNLISNIVAEFKMYVNYIVILHINF